MKKYIITEEQLNLLISVVSKTKVASDLEILGVNVILRQVTSTLAPEEKPATPPEKTENQ